MPKVKQLITGSCSHCRAIFKIGASNGTIHKHGPRTNPCPGSGQPPEDTTLTDSSQTLTSSQWRSDEFRAPPQTTCLGLWPRGYGDYFFLAGPWRAPSASRAPPPPAVAGPAWPSLRHCLQRSFEHIRDTVIAVYTLRGVWCFTVSVCVDDSAFSPRTSRPVDKANPSIITARMLHLAGEFNPKDRE